MTTLNKVHVFLDTKDINESVRYYSTLFDMAPTKVKPGYAKFDVANPPINLTLGQTTAPNVYGPNHMGIRYNSLDEVIAAKERLEKAGFTTMDEMGTTCCYAVQDKVWSIDPSGNRWEVYIFKGDAESFGHAPPQKNEACSPGGACCSDVIAADQKAAATQAAAEKPAAAKAEKSGVGVACCASDSRTAEQMKTACC